MTVHKNGHLFLLAPCGAAGKPEFCPEFAAGKGTGRVSGVRGIGLDGQERRPWTHYTAQDVRTDGSRGTDGAVNSVEKALASQRGPRPRDFVPRLTITSDTRGVRSRPPGVCRVLLGSAPAFARLVSCMPQIPEAGFHPSSRRSHCRCMQVPRRASESRLICLSPGSAVKCT
jgi:hypothetical protein